MKPLRTLKEESLLFNSELISLKGNEYVKGYYQTEKYFSEIWNILIEQFTINKDISISTSL